MKSNREYIALLLLTIILVVFFWPVIFMAKTYYMRDLTYIFHPWKALCSTAIESGDIPLWNPYAYCGMPLLANWQTAIFYPFSILFYIFHFTTALKIFHFTQFLIGGYFAYLFGRKEYKSNVSSAFIMILFVLSGFFITKIEFLSYLGVISWTFGLLLLRSNPILLAIAICISFLSGHQIFIFQMIILAMFLIFDYIKTFRNTGSTNYSLRNSALTMFAVAGLSAVQLLPTIELVLKSNRGKVGIDSSIAMLHSLNIKALLGFISPLVYKATKDLVFGEYLQWDTAMHIGIIGILLAVLGLFVKGNASKKVISCSCILLGAVLAMGNNTPVYPWLYGHIFLFHTMRYPVQFVYFSIVGLIILAGVGIRYLKYSYLIILCAAAELLFISSGFQPLANNSYFYQKPQTVKILQQDNSVGRFILSPGTEKDRYLKAQSVEDGWQNARNRLYNLTSLPYHIANAYGFGEPLTTYKIESTVNSVYSVPDAQSAINGFNTLGIEYLLCKDSLLNPKGYGLLTSQPLYIYKIKSTHSMYDFIPYTNATILTYSYIGLNKRRFEFNSEKSVNFVWKECFFPGWQLFLKGNLYKTGLSDGLFPEFNLPTGKTQAYYVYRPLLFTIGIILCMITVIVLVSAGYGFLMKAANE